MRDRHPPPRQKAETNPPKAKIGERDNGPAPNSDERLDHPSRLASRLQGLAQHHNIKSAGRAIGAAVSALVTLVASVWAIVIFV